ncbi:MAG: hypothetical protein ACU0A8_08060 [Limimaricola soesokkakensis]|uniref:hypothetical protein n=1 Tax=Limimaricola soesokkakensis TaxID=1343159 RepID=UPI004058A12E
MFGSLRDQFTMRIAHVAPEPDDGSEVEEGFVDPHALKHEVDVELLETLHLRDVQLVQGGIGIFPDKCDGGQVRLLFRHGSAREVSAAAVAGIGGIAHMHSALFADLVHGAAVRDLAYRNQSWVVVIAVAATPLAVQPPLI